MSDYTQKFVTQVAQGAPLQECLAESIAAETELRRLFATDRDNKALSDPLVGLIDVFAANKSIRATQARECSDQTTLEAEYIFPLKKEQRRATGQPAIVDIDQFRTSWSVFTEGSLSQLLDWNNVVAAGGSVLASLLPLPEHARSSKRAIRKHFHEQTYATSDIDLFLYDLTPEQAEKKAIQIYEAVRDSVPWDTICVRTKHTISIHSQYPYRPVQIVLRLYKSPAEILAGFDIDSGCFLYNGDRVWGNPRAIAAVMRQANLVDMTRRSPSYEVRLAKYALRGFEVHVPSLIREDIDPTIFERSINRIEGLARLLVLEKLSDPADRTKYLEKRRELRGRPQPQGYSRRAMRRRRRLVKGDLKAAEEQFGGLTSSDYGTTAFHIPYGPGFDAKRLEKLIYKTDLGMNSTFNPKNKNRRLHRHPAFFGAIMEEVLEDCCEYCPDAHTTEEKELQAEEDKTYIRGRVEFMQEDPGRQMMTGSFHPIDEGEWAVQAYLGQVDKLFQAVANDDVETVRDIVDNGFDLKRRDHVGRTPLHVAIMSKSQNVATYLIDNGCRITSRLVDGRTALHLACQLGLADIISKLLEKSKKNEIKAEQEKAEAEAKEKAKAQEKEADDEMSDQSADEDDDMRPSSDDDWDSEEEAEKKKKAEASKPSATVNDPPVEGAALPDDNDELPDILELNAVDWDHALSPLSHAVIAGHLAAVDTLIRAGADVQTPFKKGTYNTMTLYPLTLTLLTEDESAACAIAERLLEGGASCTAADETLKTIFHRAVLGGSMSIVRTFLRVDPNSKTALDFLTQQNWANAFTPLASAVASSDRAMSALLIASGSKVKITEEMFDKSWDARQNMNNNYGYRPPKDTNQWLRDCCMMVETSLAQSNDLTFPLVQLGADVNLGVRSDYSQSFGTDKLQIISTILDKLRGCIKSIEKNYATYERMTAGVDDTKASVSYPHTVWEETDGAFLAWFAGNEKKRIVKKLDEAQKSSKQAPPPKTDVSVPWKALQEVTSAQLEWLREVERTVVANGGKTAKELNPSLVVPEPWVNPYNYVPAPQPPVEFLPVTPVIPVQYRIIRSAYQVDAVGSHLVEKYASLFEACWKGDIDTIERLCLPPKSGKRSKDAIYLQITAEMVINPLVWLRYTTVPGFYENSTGLTTLGVAILGKHWEACKAILAIAEAQHEKPKEQPKPNYQAFSPRDDSDDEDVNEDVDMDDSDVDVSKPVLIDLAHRLSTVKTPASPATLFERTRLYDSDGNRTNSAIVQATIDGDVATLERILELGQMCEPKQTMTSSSLFTILQNDSPSMLDFVIRNFGFGLPSMDEDDENENEAAEGEEKPKKKSKMYLGLNIQGKKRKDLARAADPDAPSSYSSNTLPLMWQAAQNDARKVLTWLTTPGPLQAYKVYMSQSQDEAATVMKRIPKFEDKLPALLGATPNDLNENIMFAHLTSATPKLETLSLIFNLFPHLKKTFVHRKVKGLSITALLYVCGANLQPEIFDLFVARGSEVLATDYRGCNMLHALVWRGHLNLLKHVFTKLNKDQLATMLSQPTKGRENTPFMLAVKSGRINVVDFLLSFDHPVTAASVTIRDAAGSLPIHYAVSQGYAKIAKSILATASGTKTLFVENGVGSTPLEMADLQNALQQTTYGFKNQDSTPNPWSPSTNVLANNTKYEENTKSTNYELLKSFVLNSPDVNKVKAEDVKALEDIVLSLDHEGRFVGQPMVKQVLEDYVQRTRAAAVRWEQLVTVREEFKKADEAMSPPPTEPKVEQDPGLEIDKQDIKGTFDLIRESIRASNTRKRRELVHLLDAQRAVNSALAAATRKGQPGGRHQFSQGGTFDYKANTYTTVQQKKETTTNETEEEKAGAYRYMLNYVGANLQFTN